MRRWIVILMIVHALPASVAWADAGNDRPDRLCENAAAADREAKEAERKSEERQRFLKGRENIADKTRLTPASATSALRQSVKAQTAQARAILSQLRQGAAAANTDRGFVPGLSQYFTQMESGISRMLQSIDACLDNPEICNLPQISCPSIPSMPSFSNSGSADLIRRTQQSYSLAANQARQTCLQLNGELRAEVERLKRESRSAAMNATSSASGGAELFGEADLQLRRAEALRRQAVQYRQEADRLSGVSGYCGAHSRNRMSSEKSRAVVAAFRSVEKRERKAATEIPLDGKVVDLKAGWEQPWEKGKALAASNIPLPKVSVWGKGEDGSAWSGDPEGEGGAWLRDKSKAAYEKGASWYREADGQVELTEFIKDAPMEIVKDSAKEVATDLLVKASGPFGKSVEAGIKILDAVKGTTEEIGEILEDAPRVIGSGSAADAQELADRAYRVPIKFLNSLFDDVTGKINLPEYHYQYKKGWGDHK